ncbi:MAG: PfkB family carbohydrate kinase [Candidatus Krumholzibacteria bacterium]|jgi:ribokinase|nr:PfkB family carbohydrate kinase [Candidatus Krumholzibacteria bacterium]
MERSFDAVAFGHTAVDFLATVPGIPETDTKMEIDSLDIQGGGPAATAAVTMSRLGLKTAFAGKVGDDIAGSMMLRSLESEGVDVSGTIVEKGGRSQISFIMVDRATASRTILWTRGSVSPIGPDEPDFGIIRRSRGLLIDSLEPRAALAAAKTARESGVPVVIDAGTLREGMMEMLPFCDYIVASSLFASQISRGGTNDDALKIISGFGPKASVITLGGGGCVAMAGGSRIESAAFAVDAVDTTGAGDVFHGAFLYGVIRGWDVERTMVFSNAVAAIKCRKRGGRAGIPNLGEAMSFLRERAPLFDTGAA